MKKNYMTCEKGIKQSYVGHVIHACCTSSTKDLAPFLTISMHKYHKICVHISSCNFLQTYQYIYLQNKSKSKHMFGKLMISHPWAIAISAFLSICSWAFSSPAAYGFTLENLQWWGLDYGFGCVPASPTVDVWSRQSLVIVDTNYTIHQLWVPEWLVKEPNPSCEWPDLLPTP